MRKHNPTIWIKKEMNFKQMKSIYNKRRRKLCQKTPNMKQNHTCWLVGWLAAADVVVEDDDDETSPEEGVLEN